MGSPVQVVSIRSPADAVGAGYRPDYRGPQGRGVTVDPVDQCQYRPGQYAWISRTGVVNGQQEAASSAPNRRNGHPQHRPRASGIRNSPSGNQQKVVIGRWLERDCTVLLFDEPTRGIDIGAKFDIFGCWAS